jgi:aminoglycoside phosphotransferase (APT) family kinase protein
MGVLPQGTAPAGTENADLRETIEDVFARGSGSSVKAVHSRRFPGATSYAAQIVTVELVSGETVDIFLKDYGRSSQPKDSAAERRERELRVYEELLADMELGTAFLYGSRRDKAAARFWLMLELVEGELLRDCSFDAWLPAAAWLGRLHGSFVAQRDRLRACRFLARHDTAFFIHASERALQTLSGFSKPLGRRLAAVLERYDPIISMLAREPETLVHGSYRKQNVLVVRSSQPPRICPTDWELAAFGRAAFDLAYLSDGYRPPRLDALFDAYEAEAARFGLPVRDREELRREVDCFCLHKTINSLSHLRQWRSPEKTAPKVVASAEQIAASLS